MIRSRLSAISLVSAVNPGAITEIAASGKMISSSVITKAKRPAVVINRLAKSKALSVPSFCIERLKTGIKADATAVPSVMSKNTRGMRLAAEKAALAAEVP
ncbi:hypothetical protein SDC9_173189 [bioreactor metagenome]|uniref:Uncharacterized protein n=1 Tax=bioreactor metagenome TaxID=1076179 RepID=A0A645GPA0_9ZZZZ